MGATKSKKTIRINKKRLTITGIIVLVVIGMLVTAPIVYGFCQGDKIFKCVYVNDKSVGGMSKDSLGDFLKTNYQDKQKDTELVVKIDGKTKSIKLSDLAIKYDLQGISDKAFSVGRTGGFFERVKHSLKSIVSGEETITVTYSLDEGKLNNYIDSIVKSADLGLKQPELIINDNKVSIRSGHTGKTVDEAKLKDEIKKAIETLKVTEIEAPVTTAAPSKIDAADYYKKIIQEPANAKTKVTNNKLEIIPHVVGRSIEKAQLESIISEVEKTEDSEKEVPVQLKQPKITTQDLKNGLFKDTLGYMETQFYTDSVNNSNRGVNIRLAVQKINGRILAPGDVFSFNQVVGPRSEEGGYKTAHTYVAGQIVDGIGGGICQVSTTLYNAVLFSDLDVLERSNHQFTVGYVPLGRDAAVSYDDTDLKFKNSTNWPLKVEGWVTDDNQICFSVVGTNENPGKKISLEPKTVKTLNPDVIYIDDPTMPQGTQDVIQEAMPGYVIDTYKTVTVNGKVISRDKIHTSTYQALNRKIKRGTKKA
ncbi:MAG TPA: VanW family protein [Clostridia bacterium]